MEEPAGRVGGAAFAEAELGLAGIVWPGPVEGVGRFHFVEAIGGGCCGEEAAVAVGLREGRVPLSEGWLAAAVCVPLRKGMRAARYDPVLAQPQVVATAKVKAIGKSR